MHVALPSVYNSLIMSGAIQKICKIMRSGLASTTGKTLVIGRAWLPSLIFKFQTSKGFHFSLLRGNFRRFGFWSSKQYHTEDCKG